MSLSPLVLVLASACAAVAVAQDQPVGYSISGHVVIIPQGSVQVGPTRVIAREARTPQVASWSDGTQVLTAGNPLVSTTIRSSDDGWLWTPQEQYFGYLNTVETAGGDMLVVDYDLKLLDAGTGLYRLDRWISPDKGISLTGPITTGRAVLPPEHFEPDNPHWVNEVVRTPAGELLAVVQSLAPGAATTNDPWDTALIESLDGGNTWMFKSMVAGKDTITDPQRKLVQHGWPLYYATEPTLLHVGGGNLVCVMRSANDEHPGLSTSLIGAPAGAYHDLASTVAGDGIHPSLMSLPSNQYYQPGPPNAPLVIARSSDGGTTWTPATPMERARGVFPRLATDGKGIIALSYGALSGVPRWGHAIVLSFDGGTTWTREIPFGSFLTTGYTDLVAVGPGHFVAFYDATPPQPWTSYERWWVGVVDIQVFEGMLPPAVAEEPPP